MAIPYITIGCPTTGGGTVISGNSTFLVEGIAIACIGDKATCPKHKTTATIVSGDPYMQVMGKSVARVNDSLSCGCKLLPKQSLVVGATGPSKGEVNNSSQNILNNNSLNEFSNEKYGHRFLLKDELSNEPLANICYEIKKNGEIMHGTTDQNGFTEFIVDDAAFDITINITCKEHQHG